MIVTTLVFSFRIVSNINVCLFCFSECSVCIPSKVGRTCCFKGGSWYGKCGRSGDNNFDHTWAEGFKACATNRAVNAKKEVKRVNDVQGKEDSPLMSSQKQAVSASVFATVSPVTITMGLIYCVMFGEVVLGS